MQVSAKPLVLLSLLLFAGCQSRIQFEKKDILGVWLRNDGSFFHGLTKDGRTSSYEEFEKNGHYFRVVHARGDKIETYVITHGIWNVDDSNLTIRYRGEFSVEIESTRTGEFQDMDIPTELTVTRLDQKNLTYVQPGGGLVHLVRGEFPSDVPNEYRRPTGQFFLELEYGDRMPHWHGNLKEKSDAAPQKRQNSVR